MLILNSDFPPCGANEYQCYDKSCVDASQRCDGKTDCFDSSDEDGCGNNNFICCKNGTLYPVPIHY